MNEIHSIRFTPFYVHERGNSEHDTRQNHSPRRFVRRGSLTHIYIYMIYHPMFTRRVYIFLLVYIVPKTYCILFGNYAKHTSCLLRVLCKSTSGTFWILRFHRRTHKRISVLRQSPSVKVIHNTTHKIHVALEFRVVLIYSRKTFGNRKQIKSRIMRVHYI